MSGRGFTVRGTRNGSLVHVTWSEGGEVTGDPPTVDLLHSYVEIVERVHADAYAARAHPDLADLPADPLAEPASAHRLIQHVLDSVRVTDGCQPSDGTGP